jgi:phage tail sheath protein FI
MPEYLAPGVFVEEVSYRSKSIEGVSTTTTGFVGPTRYGPTDGDLEVLTSLGDFERTYGDGENLVWEDLKAPNFTWHAVKAFFDQGGARLYVKRVFRAGAGTGFARGTLGPTVLDSASQQDKDDAAKISVSVDARFPGTAGNGLATFTLSLGPSVLSMNDGEPVLKGVQERDVVLIRNVAFSPPNSPPDVPPDETFYIAQKSADPASGGWTFTPGGGGGTDVNLSALLAVPDPKLTDEVRVLTMSISFASSAEGAIPVTWTGLPLDPGHATGGAPDSAFSIFSDTPPSAALARTIPIALHPGTDVTDGLGLLSAIDAVDPTRAIKSNLLSPTSTAAQRTLALLLEGGDDGVRPGAPEYAGDAVDIDDKSGLKAFEDVEDISIVAAPGITWRYEYDAAWRPTSAGIIQEIIGHAERMRYRIAVLESADGQGVSDVAALRGTIDSTHAALYYPWITIVDPVTRAELDVPPGGFACGIYARNDIERSVVKAPANEVVSGAISFEKLLNKAQQEVLNPLGVNCFRFFEGRGLRLWGARTISSDPEWKYVNVRRYFAYLEHSVDRGTQWAVFEPNGERLWANVRKTVSDFLFGEFQNGAFLGEKPTDAYFVKCDRSTMSQNDIDNGRLVCLVGVAVLKPAEFVIFRIGQWTADRKV